MSIESPIACDLTAMNAEQRARHQTAARQLHAEIQEVRELPDGYAFRFPGESSMVRKVAEFITLDRLCCPFLTFALEIERERGPLWLRMTGREGTKQFLKEAWHLQTGEMGARED